MDATPDTLVKVKLPDRWKALDAKKSTIITRSEDYARWTLPYIFPETDTKHSELQGSVDPLGARSVNHLANKLVMTLFIPSQPFFRLQVTDEVLAQIKADAEAGDQDANEIMALVDKELAEAEKAAMRELDFNKYRTEATTVAKALIITGNALIYHPEGKGRVQSYSLRDYCVVRDLSGTVVEIMTRDVKALFTFSKDVQDKLQAANKGKYKSNKDVTIYTRLELKEDGKFHLTQSADDIELDSKGTWPPEELPWIALTWNLIRGEDYGRGLVEDYAGAFHGLYILTNAILDIAAISADIKFLVKPTSMLDPVALNNSKSGSYHTGEEGDITCPQLNKINDLQIVLSQIESYQKQIGAAFLLNSAVQRDAERVTAEEIRRDINDLELSHGGIYSRFAEEWQLRTATLMLKRVDIKIGKGETIQPMIITGLDSLSRAGDLDNLRLYISDLAMLDAVPEDIRMVIDPLRFAQFIGIRRGVDYDKILKSQKQLEADQQRQAQAGTDAINAQTGGKMAVEVGKQAMKEEA